MFEKVNPQIDAFCDLIADCEGTEGKGDHGYNVIVGGKLFLSYDDHPRKRVFIPRIHDWSTAAGRYQILVRNYDFYKITLHLTNFSPRSQDLIAIQIIKEQLAYKDILDGRIISAIKKCSNIWASFPGNEYGQRIVEIENCLKVYKKYGGYSVDY